MTSKSMRSSSAASSSLDAFWVSTHSISVQPSCTRSTSGRAPVTAWVKLTIRSLCHPGGRLRYHSTSVGCWLRTPTALGVRWKTKSSSATRASWGTTCTAVAPVPMMPTRLPTSPSIGSVGPPPVVA